MRSEEAESLAVGHAKRLQQHLSTFSMEQDQELILHNTPENKHPTALAWTDLWFGVFSSFSFHPNASSSAAQENSRPHPGPFSCFLGGKAVDRDQRGHVSIVFFMRLGGRAGYPRQPPYVSYDFIPYLWHSSPSRPERPCINLVSYFVGDRAVYRGQRVIGIFFLSASRRLAMGQIRNYCMGSYTLSLISILVVSLRS